MNSKKKLQRFQNLQLVMHVQDPTHRPIDPAAMEKLIHTVHIMEQK